MEIRLKEIQSNLLKWYEIYGRNYLPWRNTNNIYHVYLSEVMLQQTQVSRVMEIYYPLFLERFPTIENLANASLDEVLALWSGLGYYSRARNLHKTAILSKNNFPSSQSELKKLPGIGQYTASAICSFGYHQNIPVVDTNIARVMKRFFGLRDSSSKIIWEKAEEFLNHQRSRDHNLALMDLGSLLCTPKKPKCEICPLNKRCLGKFEPESFTQIKKKEYEYLELFYGVYIKNNKIALVCTSGNMYKNMLELPSVDPIEEDFLGSFRHSYTKYRLLVKLYKIDELEEEVIWINLNSFESTPISSLTKKVKKFIA